MNVWAKRLGAMMIASAMLTGTSLWTGGLGAGEVHAAESVQQNRIAVLGKGELSVKPDIVYLSIGVESFAETAKSAQKSTAQKIAKVNQLLTKTWKIDEKDIKTVEFYVQPNYSYSEKEGRKVQNYSANHTLEVTMRDLSKVGELLDAAAEAGANNIGNARFSVENRDAYEAQVIEKAMANAELKAQAIAKASKRQLGAVVNVAQDQALNVDLFSMGNMATAEAKMDQASTSVKPGEIKLTTQLYVQYEMK
ncbi:SIMPL domain-containing protein [Paenibacillus faecalis]|uniref:SIMPL domain-containing protein n=1 Tax=Paenibacillus faecalis TaxID=2079532 RepID=UPI000D0F3730|nr:SIMPL domain-containing protein [Paenibacillus faecalis]